MPTKKKTGRALIVDTRRLAAKAVRQTRSSGYQDGYRAALRYCAKKLNERADVFMMIASGSAHIPGVARVGRSKALTLRISAKDFLREARSTGTPRKARKHG